MKPNPELPASPCIAPPSGDPRTSFLHVDQLSQDEKTKWITAANAAGLRLADWVQRSLNKEAAVELAKTKLNPDAPKAPPNA